MDSAESKSGEMGKADVKRSRMRGSGGKRKASAPDCTPGIVSAACPAPHHGSSIFLSPNKCHPPFVFC